MEIKINNKPTYADDYEFIVAKKYDDEWWFWGAYSNGFRAEQAAIEINGAIFHNLQIQGGEKMKKFYCPVNGWDCPYWKKDGTCKMVDEGDDPVKECDDAATFGNEDDDT